MAVSFCGHDNNFCIAVTGEPFWEMIIIDVNRMKIAGQTKINQAVQKVIVNPKMIDFVTVIGENRVLNFKTKEDQILP